MWYWTWCNCRVHCMLAGYMHLSCEFRETCIRFVGTLKCITTSILFSSKDSSNNKAILQMYKWMFLCQLRCDLASYVPEFCSFSPTKGGKVPVDGLTIEDKLEGVHPVLFWFVFAVSTLGVLMAIAFLIFNVYNQNVRWGFNVKVEAEAVTVIPVNFRISSSSLANQTGRFQEKWIVDQLRRKVTARRWHFSVIHSCSQ